MLNYRNRLRALVPFLRALMKLVGLYVLIPLYAATLWSLSGEPLDPLIWKYAIPLGALGFGLFLAAERSRRNINSRD